MRLLAILVPAALGCDAAYQLERPAIAADATDTDEPGTDAGPLAACPPGQTIGLPLVADSYLDGNGGHGAAPVLGLSGDAETIILRFALPVAADAISSIQLALHPVARATACDATSGCAACASQPGQVTVYWMRTDWDEATADRANRSAGTPWESAGATGGSDRTLAVRAIELDDRNLIATVPFDHTLLNPGWPTGELGIQLVRAPGTFAGTFASRETADNGCTGETPRPQAIATCR